MANQESRYTYSVVIPHYNAPEMLQRMLDSIPQRDDIEVIVVDDGSKPENVEKLNKVSHKNLTIILNPENRGGGYARNCGLERATGTWFISVDSDDYFASNAFEIFDANIEPKLDVLMFCVLCVDENGVLTGYKPKANESVLEYLRSQDEKSTNLIRYRNTDSWNKLVSLDFIKKNGIRYEDCRVNIDVFYALSVGHKAKKIKVIDNVLYFLVGSSDSITKKKRTIEREFSFYLQAVKRNGFYEKVNLKRHPYYRNEWLYIPYILKKHGLKGLIDFLKIKKVNKDLVKSCRSAYNSILE